MYCSFKTQSHFPLTYPKSGAEPNAQNFLNTPCYLSGFYPKQGAQYPTQQPAYPAQLQQAQFSGGYALPPQQSAGGYLPYGAQGPYGVPPPPYSEPAQGPANSGYNVLVC